MQRVSFHRLLSLVNVESGAVGVAFMSDNPVAATTLPASVLETRNELIEQTARNVVGGAGSGFLQRFVASFAGQLIAHATREFDAYARFKHCELAFFLNDAGKAELGPDSMIAFAVENGNGVQIKPRRFHDGYSWRWLTCSAERMKAMLWDMCLVQNTPFDAAQMARTITSPGPERAESAFCVLVCMRLLRYLPSPQFHNARANIFTVDEFFRIVDSCGPVAKGAMNVSPAELRAMYGHDAVERHVFVQEAAALAAVPLRRPKTAAARARVGKTAPPAVRQKQK